MKNNENVNKGAIESKVKVKVEDEVVNIKETEKKYENLRLLPIETIDTMLDYIYSQNKEAFDLYFNLLRIKETNKIKYKTDAPVSAK